MQNVTSVSIECTLGYQKVNQARSGCPTSTMRARHRAAVADHADDDGAVDHRLEFLELQDVEQEAGEEGAGAERDDREVQEDPQAEGVAVVHVGLVQALTRHRPAQYAPKRSSATQGASHSRKRGVEQRRTPRVMNSLSISLTTSVLLSGAGRAGDFAHPGLLRVVVDLRIGTERFQHAEAVRLARAPERFRWPDRSGCRSGSRRWGRLRRRPGCSPPASISVLPLAAALALAACQRPWQKLHFSTTPRMRGATSGFRVFSMPAGQAGSHQLK